MIYWGRSLRLLDAISYAKELAVNQDVMHQVKGLAANLPTKVRPECRRLDRIPLGA